MVSPSTLVDPDTHANYLDISTTHVHFDWSIDWEKRVIAGEATHDLVAHTEVDHVM